MRQQLKRLENWHHGHECSVSYRLMKKLDWKSFAIGVLLTTTVMFGTGAATSTTEKWDANQQREVTSSGISYSQKLKRDGFEPFQTLGRDLLWRKRIK